MAGGSLLVLLDDIATVLDDVAAMTKVAARKTAGVLGDDLALNAQQVTGVRADRELSVVWGVAKGSFRNKLILVPLALLISVIAPWLIQPMLLLGGLFLCFEGMEKIFEKMLHKNSNQEKETIDEAALAEQPDIDEYEKEKIKGAVRTDFILSAEIIVIALGVVQGYPLVTQAMVVSVIATVMTAGVYGLVAGIVKLDDAGIFLVKKSKSGSLTMHFGNLLVNTAPYLMKLLAFVGTVAMFLVGGGIVVHAVPHSHEFIESTLQAINHPLATATVPQAVNGIVGIVSGTIVLAIVTIVSKLKAKL
ncbi:DUF808 domain-containing protein [Photobacterium leiognathi]|uniref:DUF808 domain-containing protein n=1 Tax=Photobacterium leiognathi TaxID=553611 RepID=UPI001EDE6B00|nr:DUF808 domain-containing protein [Photobacterium leiognathi]MCG3883695.1 DUF808 domain-containing protein [Photobacterium leiognathi]